MATLAELFDQAVRHHQSGNLAQAETLCRQVLQADSTHARALHLLGVILKRQGQLAEAAACFRQALQGVPNRADIHNNLGNVLLDQGNLDEAVACYRQALRINPNYEHGHYNLGKALQEQGQFDEAIQHYRDVLRINPNHADAFNNVGGILKEEGRIVEAIGCFRQALALNPNHGDAHNNLGLALDDQGQTTEAFACYLKSLDINPNHVNALLNMGNALIQQGKLEEAVASYRKALRLKPDFDEAHFSLGLLYLYMGNFEEGWPEYEWRRRLKRLVDRSFSQPRWDGSPLSGKIILLHAEQGLGDTLQFIRYAPLVKQQGGTVLLDCPPELERLLHTCAGIDKVLPAGSIIPPFDVQIPLLSLPAVMKTTLATVPAAIPYLSADVVLTQRWQDELSQYSEFKIGIIWQGNPRFEQRDCRPAVLRRSISLAQFQPLALTPGVRLFSLQKGYGTEQLAEWKSRWDIIDLGERLNDFMDTAAVMMNLDLIISADTSPAHLAGALGRPVWTVLPFAGCWRWLQDRSDSPWYPTMRLFHQPRPGDWQAVFERMAEELGALVSTG